MNGEIGQLKAEIAILRAMVLAQAPVGGLRDAQILVESARESAAILGRQEQYADSSVIPKGTK